jgi:hypothetical protein
LGVPDRQKSDLLRPEGRTAYRGVPQAEGMNANVHAQPIRFKLRKETLVNTASATLSVILDRQE